MISRRQSTIGTRIQAAQARERRHTEDRILILASSGRDGPLAAAALEREGFTAETCANVDELCAGILAGAAVALTTEEVLEPRTREQITTLLQQQPLWSDFPLVILAARAATPNGRHRFADAVATLGNATVLNRPLHAEAMLSAVRSALRARQRQYQARALLGQLEAAVRERDHFLATLSHELRNPLGAISNATQLLARAAPQPAAVRPLAVLDRQTRHLARLVDDLLDVSRVTTGKVVLKRRVLDLRTILAQVVQQHEPLMEAQGLRLLSSFGSRPLPVDGDPMRLEQVFTNLLTNALKYTPRGGRVAITADLGGDVVHVHVTDTGVGIAPDVLPALFRLFAQADVSLDRSQGGMGIGLTLVRSLLELHGGSVSASSAGLGKGAEFTVTLPLDRTAALEQPAPPPAVGVRVGRHILLVEDNPDNRESLQELLESEGHRVEVAEDGPEAVARATAIRPEVAIIDIGLPGMDGFEVARQIRRTLGPDVVLVALTGYGQPEDRRKAAEAGFNAHVTKPASLANLDAILTPRSPGRSDIRH